MELDQTNSLVPLREYLTQIAPGQITDATKIEGLLAEAWTDLAGETEGMKPYKLFNRMEDVNWMPPVLTFRIERHGGTVMGSSRAEMQTWTINLEKRSAQCKANSYRQLSPRQRPLDVGPLVEQVAGLILEHVEDPKLKWLGDDSVRVNIGVIIPSNSAVKMTLANRRKRFRLTLSARLAPHGWVQGRANKYLLKGIKP